MDTSKSAPAYKVIFYRRVQEAEPVREWLQPLNKSERHQLGQTIHMKTRKVSKAGGSSFDGWLNEQGDVFKAEVIAGAMKRQFVMKVRAMMKVRGIGVNALQKMLGTGPSQVQRLLDPEDIGISLKSIAKLLAVLGMARQIAVEPKPSKKQVA